MQFNNQHIELLLEEPSSIFRGLNQRDKETLAQHHSFQLISKGSFLFSEGEKAHGLICLVTGKVKIYKEGVGGREQILKMVGPRSFIGFSSIFNDHRWSVSARAIEESAVCIFEKSPFTRILRRNGELSINLMKLLSEELCFYEQRTVSLTQKHIRARLAESLLLLSHQYGYEDDGKTIDISLSREDIASLSNMTTSNAIRTLSNIASEGSIEINGRKISILDNTMLEHISEFG